MFSGITQNETYSNGGHTTPSIAISTVAQNGTDENITSSIPPIFLQTEGAQSIAGAFIFAAIVLTCHQVSDAYFYMIIANNHSFLWTITSSVRLEWLYKMTCISVRPYIRKSVWPNDALPYKMGRVPHGIHFLSYYWADYFRTSYDIGPHSCSSSDFSISGHCDLGMELDTPWHSASDIHLLFSCRKPTCPCGVGISDR